VISRPNSESLASVEDKGSKEEKYCIEVQHLEHSWVYCGDRKIVVFENEKASVARV